MSQFTTWELLLAFLDGISKSHPWLVQLVSWGAATLLWNGVIEKGNARRGLAFMLLQEVVYNRKVAEKLFKETVSNPGGVPANLHLSTVAFSALTSRLSELPRSQIRPLISYYEGVHDLNGTPKQFEAFFRKFQAMNADPSAYPAEQVELEKKHLDRSLDVYKRTLPAFIEHSDTLIPSLARSATLGGRLGLTLKHLRARAGASIRAVLPSARRKALKP